MRIQSEQDPALITSDIGNESQLNNKRKCSPTTKETSKKKTKHGKNDIKTSLTTKGFKRHFAEHNYHDYAEMKPSDIGADKARRGSRGGVHHPFPAVLHQMMEEAEDKTFSDIVSWQSHGRAFLIHEPKAFVKDVLPKYFKHSKLSSFQRQLSLYGFVRLTQDGRDRGAYYHECFLRGRSFLCSKIKRTRIKGTWVRTSSSPESEPDFYSMDSVGNKLEDLDSRRLGDQFSCSSSVGDATQSSSDHEDASEQSKTAMSCRSGSVENLIDSALVFCSGQQSPKSLMEFMDVHRLVCIGDKQMGSLAAPSLPEVGGLHPPPAFPNTVVVNHNDYGSSKNYHHDESRNNSSTVPTFGSEDVLRSEPMFNTLSANKFPCMVDSQWSLTASLGANITSLVPTADDDELALFLTDVDLDTDFDTDDVMQITSI